jgi:hypothetical protein
MESIKRDASSLLFSGCAEAPRETRINNNDAKKLMTLFLMIWHPLVAD